MRKQHVTISLLCDNQRDAVHAPVVFPGLDSEASAEVWHSTGNDHWQGHNVVYYAPSLPKTWDATFACSDLSAQASDARHVALWLVNAGDSDSELVE